MKWSARYRARLRDRILRELFGCNPEKRWEGKTIFYLAIPAPLENPRATQKSDAIAHVAEHARIEAAYAARRRFGSTVDIGKASLAT